MNKAVKNGFYKSDISLSSSGNDSVKSDIVVLYGRADNVPAERAVVFAHGSFTSDNDGTPERFVNYTSATHRFLAPTDTRLLSSLNHFLLWESEFERFDEAPPNQLMPDYGLLPLEPDYTEDLSINAINPAFDIILLAPDRPQRLSQLTETLASDLGYQTIEWHICRHDTPATDDKGLFLPAIQRVGRLSTHLRMFDGVANDGGGAAGGAQVSVSYTDYAADYLGGLMDAVAVFRDPALNEVNVDWLNKVSSLQNGFDGQALHFAVEIDLGNKLGYVDPTLTARLQAFRESIEDVIGHKIHLASDQLSVPSAIPGHIEAENAASLAKAIQGALDYYGENIDGDDYQVDRFAIEFGFSEQDLNRLKTIKDDLQQGRVTTDAVAHQTFEALAKFDDYFAAVSEGSFDEKALRMPWAEDLNTALQLQRLEDPSFKLRVIGDTFDRLTGVSAEQAADTYTAVAKTNIPGLFVGLELDPNATPEARDASIKTQLQKNLDILSSGLDTQSPDHNLFARQLLTAALAGNDNHDTLNEIYGVDQNGFVFGYDPDGVGEAADNATAFSDYVTQANDPAGKKGLLSRLVLGDDSASTNTLSNTYHELWHIITQDNYVTANANGDPVRTLTLANGKKLTWTQGIEERLATGSQLEGNTHFITDPLNTPIGWISENTFHESRGIPAVLFYPFDATETDSPASRSFRVPDGLVKERLQQIKLPDSAVFFDNVYQVYSYLNQVQSEVQRLRLMDEALHNPYINNGISPENRAAINDEVVTRYQILKGDSLKLATAASLVPFGMLGQDTPDLSTLTPEQIDSLVEKDLNVIVSDAVAFLQQLPKGTFDLKELAGEIKNQIQAQYQDYFFNQYGTKPDELAATLKATPSLETLIAQHPTDLFAIDRPAGIIEGTPNPVDVEAYRSFANKLGFGDKVLDTDIGSRADFNRLLVEARQETKAEDFYTALVDAVPEAQSVYQRAGVSGNNLYDALAANVDTVEAIQRTTQSFRFLRDDGTALKIPPFDPDADVKGYNRITLDNGDAVFLPSEEGYEPFRLTESFIDRVTWLRRGSLNADVDTIAESVRFYQALTSFEGRPQALSDMLAVRLLNYTLLPDSQLYQPDIHNAFSAFVADTASLIISARSDATGRVDLNVGAILEAITTTFGGDPGLFIDKVLDVAPDSAPLVFRAFPEFSAPIALRQQGDIFHRYLNVATLAVEELARLTGDSSLLQQPAADVLAAVDKITGNDLSENVRVQITNNRELLRASIAAIHDQQTPLVDTARRLGLEVPDTNAIEGLPGVLLELTSALTSENISQFDAAKAAEVGDLLRGFRGKARYTETLNNQLLQLVTPEALYNLLSSNVSAVNQLLADGGYKEFYVDKLLYRHLQSPAAFAGSDTQLTSLKHILGAGLLIQLDYAGDLAAQRQSIGESISRSLDLLETYRPAFASDADFQRFAADWSVAILDSYDSMSANRIKFSDVLDNSTINRITQYFNDGAAYLPKREADYYQKILDGRLREHSLETLISNIDKPLGSDVGDYLNFLDPDAFTPNDDFRVLDPLIPEDSFVAKLRTELSARKVGLNLISAVDQIRAANQLSGDWVPVLSTAEDLGDGTYQVRFINSADDDAAPHTIVTDNADIFKTRQFIDNNDAAVLKAYKPDASGALRIRDDVPEVEGINGLNAAFAIHALFGFLERGRLAGETDNSQLATVLRAHEYLNLAQTAYGLAVDGLELIKLVKEGITISRTVVKEASAATKTISAVGSIGLGGIDVLAGLASTGLDIYELTQAHTDSEKAIIGTQLAFDSAGVLLGGTSVGLGITSLAAGAAEATAVAAAASTAGTLVGGAGVIFAGLGIGITALVQAFSRVSDNAQQVGRFFNAIDQTYKNGGFTYDSSKDIVKPVGQGIVSRVDFGNGKVSFGTHRIYRTHHGSTGSGKQNYFFWSGDFPTLVRDEHQALNVRDKIGYGSSANLSNSERNAKIFIAPVTPNTSTISYSWNTLPGSTTRHDEGFDVIRRLENDYSFDYDFYIFPSEYTIDDIDFSYQRTNIEINLDKKDRVVVIPDIPNEYIGKTYHNLFGHGGNYTLALNDHAELYIHSPEKSNWIIESSNVGSQSLRITDNAVFVGNAKAQFGDLGNANVLYNTTDGDVSSIDFESHKAIAVFVNGESVNKDGKNTGKARADLVQHLENLKKQGRIDSLTTVSHYHGSDGKVYDQAYFDRDSSRLLYTEGNTDATLVGFLQKNDGDETVSDKDKALFFDTKANRLSLVDAASHKVLSDHQLPGFRDKVTVLGAIEENGTLITRLRQTLSDGRTVDYILHDEEGTLVLDSIMGDNDLVATLRDAKTLDGKVLAAYFSTDVKLSPELRIVPQALETDRVHDRAIHHIDGKIYLTAGDHVFTVTHDDGLKFVVNGQTLINSDSWENGKPSDVHFNADKDGYYDLNALYFENTGSAILKVAVDGEVLDKTHFAGSDGQFIRGEVWFAPSNLYSIGAASDYIQHHSLDGYYTINALDFRETSGSLADFLNHNATVIQSPVYALPASGQILKPAVDGGDGDLVLVSGGSTTDATLNAQGVITPAATSGAVEANQPSGFLYYNQHTSTLYSQASTNAAVQVVHLPSLGSEDASTKITSVLPVGAGVLVSDDQGVSWLVTGDGEQALISVSEKWIQANDDWHDLLKQHFGDTHALALQKNLGLTFAPPVLVGGFSVDGSDVKSWYDPLSGNLLVADVDNADSVRLLSIDDDRKRAWLFDEKSHALYRQSLVGEDKLQQLLDSDSQHLDASIVDAPEAVLADQTLTNAIVSSNGIVAFSEAGLVYGIADNTLSIVGVSQAWLGNNDQLPDGLHTSDVLQVFDADQQVAGWFLPKSGQSFIAPEQEDNNPSRLLGFDAQYHTAWLAHADDSGTDTLYQLQADGQVTEAGHFKLATVLDGTQGKALALVGGDNSQLQQLPELAGIHSLVLAPTDGQLDLSLTSDLLASYSQITIDGSQLADGAASGTLNIDEPWLTHDVELTRVADNLTLFNRETGHRLVFSGSADNNLLADLHLHTQDNLDLSVGDLISGFNKAYPGGSVPEAGDGSGEGAAVLSIDDIWLNHLVQNADGGDSHASVIPADKDGSLAVAGMLADKYIKVDDNQAKTDAANPEQQPLYNSLQQAMAGFGAETGAMTTATSEQSKTSITLTGNELKELDQDKLLDKYQA